MIKCKNKKRLNRYDALFDENSKGNDYNSNKHNSHLRQNYSGNVSNLPAFIVDISFLMFFEKPTSIPTIVPRSDFGVGAAVTGGGGSVG